MSISLLRQLLMKEAVKKSAGASGIMTINKNIAKDVERQLQKYINDALAQGVDLDTLSPDQLKMIVAMNQPKPPKVFSGQEAMDQLNKLFPKKGEVFDLQGNKLNPNKPIMGGTQGIETLLKKGDVTKGTVSKKSDKVVEREMFEEANKKFNQTDIVADSVARITSMEPVAAMKEANKIIKREGIYKNLNKNQSQKILKDTDDWINQRDPSDLYDYNKNRPFRDDPNFDPDDPDFDPEQGYYTGGMVDVEPNLSDIGHGSDALMARTRLISPGAQGTTSTGLNYLLAEDNDNIRVPFAGGKSFSESELLEFNKAIKEKIKKGGRSNMPVIDPKKYKKYLESFKTTKAAEGGRIGFKDGGMGRRAFLKLLAALTGGVAAAKSGILSLGGKGAAKKTLPMITTPNAPGKPEWFDALVTKIIREGDDVTKKFATKEREIVYRKKIDDETEVIVTQDLDNNVTRIDIDDSVRNVTGFDDPPTVSLQVTDEIVEEGGIRTKPKFEATENDYRNYATDPDGGYETEFVENTVENTKDLTSDLTKIKSYATNKKETMKEFVESKKRKDNVKYAQENPSSYAADRGPDYDPSDYIDDMADDMAIGGRAGFSAGSLAKLGITGSSRRFLEKVFGKQNLDTMITRDPEMHRGLLEVVEMFRNRDKEGLKMYMQKFLPHMDDETVEAFIRGDAADAAGQGKFGLDNMQGQLIRLGSGRDYAGKLEMMKKLDNVKKLDNLDVTEEMIRKPNAFGGIQTMLGE